MPAPSLLLLAALLIARVWAGTPVPTFGKNVVPYIPQVCRPRLLVPIPPGRY